MKPTDEVTRIRRKFAGQRAVAAGGALEQWVDGQHQLAAALGLAEVRQVSPAVAILRMNKDGSFVGRWRGPSGVDRRGTLAGGRALLVEVKSTEKPSLPRSYFTTHEIEDLDRCVRLGGLALVLWQDRSPGGGLFVLPWHFIEWTQRGGGRSVSRAWAATWAVRDNPYLRPFVPRAAVGGAL